MFRFIYPFVVLTYVVVVAENKTINDTLPSFLQGESQEVIDQFKAILGTAHDKSDPQVDAEITKFVNEKGGELKKKYEVFRAEIQKEIEIGKKAHQKAYEKFSPEAKKIDRELTAIANNNQLTGQEKLKRFAEIMKNMPNSVREEIQKAMKAASESPQ
ncbi:hypothetical protein AB6A40_004397 [Gnathostoma spinigerum]|uniref:SXP/RAL-2 family protein Ani s 5-like cation-binding domain-containing protein n=1 Tax=Gnathostoma spinigerum TaxID=75299 RepID=A0ABD6ECI1_9BILA